MSCSTRASGYLDYQDLERFIKKALDAKDSARPGRAPEARELKQIAKKYGLSEEQWADLCREADEHIVRGRNFASVGDWDEAIKELDQAHSIVPYNEKVEFELAQAYARRFDESRAAGDFAVAKKLLRQYIEEHPRDFKAVEEFERLKKISKSVRHRKIAIMIAFCLIVAAAAFFLPIKDLLEGEQPKVVAPLENPLSENGKPSAPRPVADETNEWTIPVDFPLAEVGEEISFETRASSLLRYKDAYRYDLKGIVKNLSVQIKTITADLELVDQDGAVLVRHAFDMVPSFRYGTLPGDSTPIQVLVFKKETMPAIKSARIIIKRFDRTPIAGELKPGRIIELIESKNSISPNFSIELRERVATRRKGTFGEKGKAQLKLVLSLKNTGNSPIKKLIFQSTVMDESGEILPLVRGSIATSFAKSGLSGYSVGAFPAVIESRPLLLPGETRVVEGTIYVPDAVPNDLAKYDISISEVE